MNLIICILGAMATVLAAFHGPYVILICCVIGTLCSAWILFGFISGSLELRLTWLLTAALLIGYCYGTFSVELSAVREGLDPLTYVGMDKSWVAYALVQVMVACCVLLLGGKIEPELTRGLEMPEVSGHQERSLWMGLSLLTLAYARGDLALEGAFAAAGTGKESALGAIAVTMLPVLASLAAIGFVQSSGARRVRFAIICGAALFFSIPVSRRSFAYAVVIAVIAATRLSGKAIRLPMTRILLICAGMLPLLAVGSLAYYSLRLASYETQGDTGSVLNVLQTAQSTSLTDLAGTVRAQDENLKERPAYLVVYLSLLGRGGETASPMLGQDMEQALKIATPDVIYTAFGGSKQSLREAGTEEDLANEHFALSDTDNANSILTAGLIDFGWVGILVYPLLICALLRFAVFVSAATLPIDATIVLIISIFFFLIQAEYSLSAYFVALRDSLILTIGWIVLSRIPRLGRRRNELALAN